MANELTAREPHPLVQFREQLESRAAELKMALPAHISPEKFQRTIITATQQNPGLLKTDRRSLILACMKAAQDGLLPDGRESALVPFRTRKKIDGQWQSVEEAAYIPMIYGLRKKVLQARDAEGKPVVSALEVGVVYRKEVEAGHFLYEVGLTPPLRHRPMLDLTADDTRDDQIVGAYSIATMADGTKSYEFMRRFEIDKVRETSQTGATRDRSGQPREAKGPWADWFPEMAKKTVLRRHAKSLPQSGDLILEADDDEFDAGVSTAAALSVVPDAPQAIEDRSDEVPHDAETGEVHEEANQDTEASNKQPEASNGDQPADATDEVGVTEHPAAAKAEQIIAAYRAAATIIDLNTVRDNAAADLEAMPDDIAGEVGREFAAAEKRLKGDKVEPEKAGAQ
jgi:recombination protein RecT